MRQAAHAALVAVVLSSSGCLAAKLRGPAEDHAIQARIVADRYAEGDYSREDLELDLEELARQAELLEQIVKQRPGDPEGDDASPE